MNNIQLFSVAPAIPPELDFLEALSRNLWWCWNSDAIELFRRIHPQVWRETGHNPLVFLGQIPQKRLESLTSDEGFLAHLEQVSERFSAEVLHGADGKPYTPPSRCLAYFSLEYGIHESLRLYSGGLGCLAGDHLKAASDLNMPLVGVGIMYRQGYFQQYLNNDGWQQESYPENAIHRWPLRRACDASNRQVSVSIAYPDGELTAVVWRLDVGRVPLYMLDANIPENPPALRGITGQLYGGDRQNRIRQELLLGIGGFRALIALGHDPVACHINEGHAAFLTLARISHLMSAAGLDLDTAAEVVRRTSVFTTHTPVPAGNEYFPRELVEPHLKALQPTLKLDPIQVMKWGQPEANNHNHLSELGMPILGLRFAQFSNGVSRLHGQVARDMWRHLWPGRPKDEVPIHHVTNGVHVPSWLSLDNAEVFDRYLGPEWRDNPGAEVVQGGIGQIPDEELWRAHELGRSRLVRTAREQMERQYRARNASRADLAAAKAVLDHDALTIGFARRFVAYKRANLLLRDPQRLEALLTNEDRPVQIVFAGKAHPADDVGKTLIRQVVQFARKPEIRRHVVFLEDYDICIGRSLVQGADIWLNTPRRPHEASGTSGMKAAVNGALHVSVLDGWWVEGYAKECGWAIGEGEEYDDPEYQDAVESQALYNLLENEIIPCFFERPAGDIPTRWIGMMKASMKMALNYFTSHRMISEYNERCYRPAIKNYDDLTANGAAKGRELVARCARFRSLWDGIRLSLPTADRDISVLHVGDKFRVSTRVTLGQIQPDEVDVEVYYGPVNSENVIVESHVAGMALKEKTADGSYVYAQELTCETTGRYGFTARVVARGDEGRTCMPGHLTWADGGKA